ncbi:SymE family type I addiction module toxin [Flavobacterium sp. FZUC8N2.13]|uniref:SymE family type I addiction module toxin n=1 Tax=Flavobacterium zubiriense TaxID=3138075 RepID=A0ABV4TAV6_9FLAO
MDIFFKSRTLKISSQFVKNLWKKPTVKPKIILSGKWMQEAGFEIGENVTISVSKNLLIISKA